MRMEKMQEPMGVERQRDRGSRKPFKYLDEFRRLAREAREQGRGLWSRST